MDKSRSSDWPAVFFVLLLFAALLAAFMPSSVKAQQPPLRKGCRAVSKLEYDTAKREYVEAAGTSSRAIFGDDTIGGATFNQRGRQMGQWLIADLSILDVQFQAWMLLVTGILLLWMLYAWRQAR